MKNFIKTVFAGAIGTVLGLVLFFFSSLFLLMAVSHLSSSRFGMNKIEKNSVLFIPLKGELAEKGGNSFFEWSEDTAFFRGPHRLGLWDLQEALNAAKNDPHIKGVYLKIGFLSAGWASLSELVQSISEFKKSGKFVYAYSEEFDEKTYYVAASANQIHGYPEGSFQFNGIGTSPIFIKGTLDKLGVTPQIFRVGEYKSAIEMFNQEKMSEASRKQNQELVDDIWNVYLNQLSSLRSIPIDTFNKIANDLSVTRMDEALEKKLIDKTSSEEELLDILKSLTHTPKDKKINLVHFKYYPFSSSEKSELINEKKRVALLFADGEIISGTNSENYIGSEDFLVTLRQIAREKNIKALVVRINSPGGSALAADVIWRQILEIKKTKPVVVSFGDVAASGGYYMAAGANYIFSSPQSMTGSIGVFGLLFNAKDLYTKKLGVTFDRVVTHPFADIGSTYRDMSDIERKKIQTEVEQTYQQFLSVVQKGRNFESIEQADHVARGRVWSGTKAVEIGLVDELGGLQAALKKAAELAQLGTNWNVDVFPREKSPVEQILQTFSQMSFVSILFPSSVLEHSQEKANMEKLIQLQKLKRIGHVLAVDFQDFLQKNL